MKMERAPIYAISAVVAAAIITGLVVSSVKPDEPKQPPFTIDEGIFNTPIEHTETLKKFSSNSELRKFLLEAAERTSVDASYSSGRDFGFFEGRPVPSAPQLTIPMESSNEAVVEKSMTSNDYSTTNVQVNGVDEPDFLKNDGKYVYILSDNKLTIVEAYPPESAKVLIKFGLDIQGQTFQNMFLDKDRLVVFYQTYGDEYAIEEYDYYPRKVYSPKTHALVLDVSDKENPKTLKNYEVTGNYVNARLINSHVYFITNSPADYNDPIIPKVMESSRTIAPDVYYFEHPLPYYTFNTVTALDLAGGDTNAETFMMDPAGTIYVSEDSIYITYTKYMPYPYYRVDSREKFFDVIVPLLPEDAQRRIREVENSSMNSFEKWDEVSQILQQTYNSMGKSERDRLFEKIQAALEDYEGRLVKESQRTIIHRIGMDRLVLKYLSEGEVPGHLLNQFSMDEYGDRFRIATTSEITSPNGWSVHNNVYVLDKNLKIVGSLEKIAPRETIYSARFMGVRLYLVTFERTDPFFAIDLSTDTPKILGELKMPGFSNYLHPYDEDYIIGIGRETEENKWGVETMGVKVALFDVSDVKNPRTVDVYEIGDQSTNSEVLSDHKALLFDKGKNVLSIPIETFSDVVPLPEPMPDPRMQSMPVIPKSWKGFYVFSIDPNDGFELKGKVDHSQTGYAYGSRSFYINDVLYTVTGSLMKMNDLDDMYEINELQLANTGEVIRYVD